MNSYTATGLIGLAIAFAPVHGATAQQLPPAGGSQTKSVTKTTRPDKSKADLAVREKWASTDFFEQPEIIKACEAISKYDNEELRMLLKSGLEANHSAKKGMTLLHWAFATDNLTAFQLLLEAGASPDRKLTDTITLESSPRWFVEGDSILFTVVRSIEPRKMDFFLVALQHSKVKDPRDAAGNTLLLACMQPAAIFSISESTLDRILETGADLDTQGEHGYTAAMYAAEWNRPYFALKILKAGADPTIRNDSGKTVGDVLEFRVKQEARVGRQYYPEVTDQIREYLKERAKK